MVIWCTRRASLPTRKWPDLPDVVTHRRDRLPRLRAAVIAPTPQQRDAPTGRSRTVCSSVVHGLHDGASHQAETDLLRKRSVRHFSTAAPNPLNVTFGQ